MPASLARFTSTARPGAAPPPPTLSEWVPHLQREHVVEGEAVVCGAVGLEVGVLDGAVAHGAAARLQLRLVNVGPAPGVLGGSCQCQACARGLGGQLSMSGLRRSFESNATAGWETGARRQRTSGGSRCQPPSKAAARLTQMEEATCAVARPWRCRRPIPPPRRPGILLLGPTSPPLSEGSPQAAPPPHPPALLDGCHAPRLGLVQQLHQAHHLGERERERKGGGM